MKSYKLLPLVALAAAGILINSGCQGNAGTNTNANKPAANANTAPANKPAENTNSANAATSPAATGSLATPSDAYATAHDMRKKKDVAGLRKVMSKDALEFIEMMGKEEKKSIDDLLKDLTERPQAEKVAVRNEKIDGDHATLDYMDENGEWKTMDFDLEGKEWKLSLPKADAKQKEPAKKP